jgi:hypothetical protein
MAARTWFTPEICEGLRQEDCAILNRAGRVLADAGWLPTHTLLMELRTTYRPGMSARELADACDPDRD